MPRIHCPQCHNCLGENIAGYWLFRWSGREMVVEPDGLVSITCDRCGRKWTVQRDWERQLAEAYSAPRSG